MKKINKKSFLLFALIAVILMAGIGGTLAYLTTKTTEVENVFKPSQVTCEVREDFNDGDTEKKDVKIKNTGDVTAYIRAAVVANWVDNAGNIVEPATVSFSSSDKWTKSGDYYYYQESVPAEGLTENLINSCKTTSREDGLHLQMTILAQAIQADGNTGATATSWSGIKNPGSTEN